MKEMRGMTMRTKMVFMKDFLITCLECPHPDLRYKSSHPNLILNTQSSTGSLQGVCPCMAEGKCNPKDNHTANQHNNWVRL